MAKGYWLSAYRAIHDPAALAAYSKLAGPAVAAAGGRVISRGMAFKTYEAGMSEPTVIVEFDSVEQAVAAYESAAYGEARAALGDAVERDFRILQGLD